MGAVGGIVAVVFGIFWTVMAFSMTRDSPFPLVGVLFPLLGVVFVVMGIINVFYNAHNAHNATGENRFSEFDITSPSEESDPLDDFVKGNSTGNATDGEISERLAKVEKLREQKLISEEEYFEQRDRILSEI